MDPKACVQRLKDAFIAGDFDEWNAAREDYAQWRKSGGFLAKVNHKVGGLVEVAGAHDFGYLRVRTANVRTVDVAMSLCEVAQ